MTERPANRLATEASPYLRQHAHNPVDWYAWGPEALERARREQRPILLSIGYSACHWCHVMERESFEDEAIAARMNELFVCIKVDREERPDLDHVYQLVVQLMGKSGGWPLTVFLTPDQRPFFGGTYFPPEDRWGMPGFPRLLQAIAAAWNERREEVVAQAADLTRAIGRASDVESRGGEPWTPGPDLLERASRRLASRFDDAHGGFGNRPKFPSTMALDVLLRRGAEEGDEPSAARVRAALHAMRAGGIWDHLAGGFHRYSTDEGWLVPHFEKMLYDNALLLRLYTDAFRATGEESFAGTARAIGAYLLREMQDADGGFYATTDADSEGEEGKYFVWTPAEVRAALGGDALAIEVALLHHGVAEGGNFEDTGASVLHENRPLAAVAKQLDRPEAEVRGALARAHAGLLTARAKRVPPFRDEKILAGWNGLAIGALADASAALGAPELLDAARRAFARIERDLVKGGRVERLVKDGVLKGPGFLEDHAFLAQAALDLYAATGESAYLERARTIADEILARFADAEGGGFFLAPSDGEALICRSKDAFDQAIPSGAAVAASVLLALAAIADPAYAAPAERHLAAVAAAAVENPFAFGHTIGALDRLVRGSVDVVIVGAAGDPRAAALREVVLRRYLPNRNLVTVDPSRPESVAAARELAEGKPAGDGPVAYVCRARACSPPVADEVALAALLAP